MAEGARRYPAHAGASLAALFAAAAWFGPSPAQLQDSVPLPVGQRWPTLRTQTTDATYDAFSVDGHVHSNISRDARHPPGVVIAHAAEVGLDAVVMTDHGATHGAAEVSNPEVTLIAGAEVGGTFGHAVVWGAHSHRSAYRDAARESFAAAAAVAHGDGGLIALAHPGWWIGNHGHDPRMWLDLGALRRGGIAEHVDMLELWNGVYPRYTEALLRDWADLWAAGAEVPIIGNSDFHSRLRHTLGTPRTFVLCRAGAAPRARRPSRDCVLDAARRGRSYITAGPAIAWTANGRVAGERIVGAAGERVVIDVELVAPPVHGPSRLQITVGNEVVAEARLERGRLRRRFEVRMPHADAPLWLRVMRERYVFFESPYSLVTNPITLDVAPARADTRPPAGSGPNAYFYSLRGGRRSRADWPADAWVRARERQLRRELRREVITARTRARRDGRRRR